MTKRYARTRQEIHGLTQEQLDGMLDPQTRGQIRKSAASVFKDEYGNLKAPEKRPDESLGQYRARKREAGEVDQKELVIAVKASSELAVWQQQQQQRFLDAMTASIDPVKSAEVAERIAWREEQHRQADREGGAAFSVTPPMISGWESPGAKAKPTQAPTSRPSNPTRPDPPRRGKKGK